MVDLIVNEEETVIGHRFIYPRVILEVRGDTQLTFTSTLTATLPCPRSVELAHVPRASIYKACYGAPHSVLTTPHTNTHFFNTFGLGATDTSGSEASIPILSFGAHTGFVMARHLTMTSVVAIWLLTRKWLPQLIRQ